jgi:hypothetical protein
MPENVADPRAPCFYLLFPGSESGNLNSLVLISLYLTGAASRRQARSPKVRDQMRTPYYWVMSFSGPPHLRG